ncbi:MULTISPECIES: methyltransferase domain-containing protein [unclassified Amycolatopsis]|uniref:class I SAM-dependent methyltransferase n=1 Tax=unclassified Amycolatopsis TaxID=2618356 RepID=UPI0028767E8E|nr:MULTISPECIES: methyltransferase domain-containing protein [unclassified Amycolatopsis]MDS0135359.1 methyltransferase domain-containing protein [Amycolatopsis sp. 505]MDS0140950.1 methyltransferase domain-containing protein [Amycolatopsis sp. CM201R]
MPTSASDRLQALLGTPAEVDDGYLDLLGAADQAGPPTGLTQRLMRTTLLPQVYERYWRPALGRALKGPLGPSMTGEIRIATELLRLKPGHTALDVACGTGRFTRAFGAAVGPDGLAIGLDGARTMLAKAVAEGGPDTVAYLRADAVHLPLKPSTVDGICCFAALHMFAEPETALDSFARVVKPGGRIVLLTSARRGWQPARLLETAGGIVSGQKMFDRGEIAASLHARGFTELTERYAGVTQIVAGRAPQNVGGPG